MTSRDALLIRPVPELLSDNARRHGERLAFAADRRRMSWGELDRRTGRIAAGLAVDRAARVAILLDDGVDLAQALFAVVRAAAVGVPLSPACTDAELAALLTDCDPAVVITDERHLAQLSRVASARPPRLVVTGDGPLPPGASRLAEPAAGAGPAAGAQPRDDLGLDEPAWMLYTSGTTGAPKGAVSTQRAALFSPVCCYPPLLGLCADDHLLWPLPMAHSFAHSLCLLGVAVAGASARIVGDPRPATVARLLREEAPTVLAAVPATYRQLLAVGPGAVPSLRLCVTAGAPSDAALRAEVAAVLGAPLLDCYGSTETCGMIAVEPVAGARTGGSWNGGTSGLPVPGVEVRLVDVATGAPAAPRADGEIFVRGPGMMLGYHGRPDATAEALPDGWYRTGDLGRFDDRGQLTVAGRVSDLIITGGANVDPVEVEQVLRGRPGVLDTAVVARADPLLGEVPVAFVVPADEALDPAGLRRACAAVLSPYKVPVEVLFTPAIPRTASGKPRRRVLRDTLAVDALPPAAGRFAGLAGHERRSALQDLVRAETAAICGAPADLATAFAELGMNSLGAVTLWQRLSALTGLRLPATLVWEHPTPAAVAAYLDTQLAGGPPVTATGRTRAETEPVAIVAMGCRYPGGVESPADLWRLVTAGVDATGDFPADRGWDVDALYDPDPDRMGRTYVRRGGFLRDVGDFDPAFFGISPREALATDPQQRLLLEVAWEVFERAGIPAPQLRGTDTGVYVGMMHSDYALRFASHELESQLGIGSAGSVASGRISYVLGLRGPTMTIDTACSSSLVAMDLAAKALRAGECTLALAGGVTTMSTVWPFIAFSRQRGLSPDGRCRSFAAGADGTAWAEGAGLVLLEKLSDAHRNGHPVLAVLRGSAVNSDGASNGLTAPNGAAHRELIRLALADAGLRAADVDVIEGHGTATSLGDPIEAAALLATYGQDRDAGNPAWLGSVKSNLGHTQAAAGVAGVIKMVEAMRHGELPRSLYAGQPSPHVDWSAGAVRLLADARPWPPGDRPRRAAVSAFGIGGTNAHVIVEEPPVAPGPAPAGEPTTPSVPWLVSGADAAGLRAHAARLAAALPDASGLDIGSALATGRAPLAHRAAVPAGDRDSQLAGLRDLAGGVDNPAIRRAVARPDPRVALLFTGQGAQRPGMGRELAATFDDFAAPFTAVCDAFAPHLDRPLREVIDGGPGDLLDRTDYAQPALFAFEVALHGLLDAAGVRPDRLAGHSIGELAAAYVAGVFSLPDAARLVAARGRLMAALPPGGAMIALRATEDEALRHCAEVSGRVGVAAVNAPRSVVVSGDEQAVAAVAARFGGRATRLRVSHAFHSPLLEPMLAEFEEVAGSVTYHRPAIPVVSGLTGRPEPDAHTTARYWVRHARETVRFADAVRGLADAGMTAFVEVGPDAAVSAATEECLGADAGLLCVPVVRRTGSERAAVLDALAALHVHGVPVVWERVLAGSGARRCDLPTYPFQRRRYWLDPAPAAARDSHPMLGGPRADADGPQVRHSGVLGVAHQPWLADHVIGDHTVLPATALAELALRAAGSPGTARLAELTILAPLVLSPDGAEVQVVVERAGATGERPLRVWARPANSGDPWTEHAAATVTGTGTPATGLPDDWPPPDAVRVPVDYDRLTTAGFRYGPAFRAVTRLWRRGDDLFADLALPPAEAITATRYALHPALLDAALHASLLAHPPTPGDPLTVPFSLADVQLFVPGAAAVRARLTRIGAAELRVVLTDPAGRLIASIGSLRTRTITLETPAQAAARNGLHRLAWTPAAAPVTAAPVTAAEYELFRVGPGSGADPATRAGELVTRTLERLQDWLAGDRPGRLVVVTHRATTDDPDPAAAAVAGLVGSARSEHPGRISLVDLCGRPASDDVLAAAAATGLAQVAVRDGGIHLPRLTAAGPPDTAPPQLDPAGTVLITGGTGALAGILARHLVTEYGIRHLLLASRRGEPPAWAADLPASVTVARCDVSDRAAVDDLVRSCRPALTAVFHLAGVVDDGVLQAMTPHRVAAVLAPKAAAAWHLHEATAALDLSAFVLYSSAAGVLGRPGQSNYAAANAFLDALARHRRAAGLPAQSLAWGLWAADDSRMTAEVSRRHLTDVGIRAIGADDGMALLDRSWRIAEPVLVPLLLNPAALGTGGAPVPPVLEHLRPQRPADVAVPAEQEAGAWRRALAGLTAAEREATLGGLIRGELAAVLGFPDPESVPAEKLFTDLGFDSLGAVQLRNRLSAVTGIPLAATIVLDHPNLPRLTAHVRALLDEVLPAPDEDHAAAADVPMSYRFTTLYHRVIRERGPAEAMALRYLASYAVPSFSAGDRARHVVPPVKLADGDRSRPVLMFIPGYMNLYNPAPTDLAGQLAGEFDLFLLDNPGFQPGRALPDTVDTLAAMHADTVHSLAGGRPVVLIGNCTGGFIAQAVAGELAAAGRPCAAMILLDTHQGDDSRADERALALVAADRHRPAELFDGFFEDSAVIAGGGYARIFERWRPAPVPVRTLLLRAEPTSEMREVDPDRDWLPRWPLDHETADLPGDHYSMLDDDAATTATAMRTWLDTLSAAEPSAAR